LARDRRFRQWSYADIRGQDDWKARSEGALSGSPIKPWFILALRYCAAWQAAAHRLDQIVRYALLHLRGHDKTLGCGAG